MEVYGQEKPPAFDLQSFSDMPVNMFCGQYDGMVSKPDYDWLRDQLRLNNNCKFYKDYEMGHLGLICPDRKSVV